MKRFLIVLLVPLGLIAVITSGCASLDAGYESDMPWNTPQTWEGSPAIPGLSN